METIERRIGRIDEALLDPDVYTDGARCKALQAERSALAARSRERPQVRCACPAELAQVRILLREGAWQEGPVGEPCLSFSEAVRAPCGSGSR